MRPLVSDIVQIKIVPYSIMSIGLYSSFGFAVGSVSPYTQDQSTRIFFFSRLDSDIETYLVNVDSGLPELLVGLVEVPHTNLTEVTRVELVNVGTVVVLTTGHTTTTGGLAVLADTTVTGRDVAAAV
jgi:hypothetical protein